MMIDSGKECSKCGQYKDISEFNRNKTSKDGYYSICKDCRKNYYEANKELIAEKEKKYRQAKKELIAERNKNYHLKNKELIAERKKEYMKEYYKANKELIAERNKNYRKENKERIAERYKKWKVENSDKVKVINQRRRARKAALSNTLTVEQWNQTLNDFNHSCANCGNKGNLHLDHFYPLAMEYRGTTASNCIPLCATCNLSKSSRHPKDFFSKEKLVEIAKYLISRKSEDDVED